MKHALFAGLLAVWLSPALARAQEDPARSADDWLDLTVDTGLVLETPRAHTFVVSLDPKIVEVLPTGVDNVIHLMGRAEGETDIELRLTGDDKSIVYHASVGPTAPLGTTGPPPDSKDLDSKGSEDDSIAPSDVSDPEYTSDWLDIAIDGSVTLQTPRPAVYVAVGQVETAELRKLTDQLFLVIGRTRGRTDLTILLANSAPVIYAVTVNEWPVNEDISLERGERTTVEVDFEIKGISSSNRGVAKLKVAKDRRSYSFKAKAAGTTDVVAFSDDQDPSVTGFRVTE